LDPRTVPQEPKNRAFIICALEKAKRISDGYFPIKEEILSITNLHSFYDCIDDGLDPELPIAIDIELSMEKGEISCIGFAQRRINGSYWAFSVPFYRTTETGDISFWTPEQEGHVWTQIARLIGSAKRLVMQNFCFDSMWLSKFGIDFSNCEIIDTMTLAHLISPELPKGLKDLGRLYLMCDVWKDLTTYDSNPHLWQYNAQDAMRTLEIYDILRKEIANDLQKNRFLVETLIPLHAEVLKMCERGWTPDLAAIQEIKDRLEPEVEKLRQDLKAACDPLLSPRETYILRKGKPKAGIIYFRGVGSPLKEKPRKSPRLTPSAPSFATYEAFNIAEDVKKLSNLSHPTYEKRVTTQEFNPRSSKKIQEVITALGYAVPKNKKGDPTADEIALRRLYEKTDEPIFAQILEFRERDKLLTTYANVKLDEDGKIRFSITIPGTVGGSFSSKKTPWDTGFNAQNIPKDFRHISLPNPGYKIINMDFKQADPHLVAWLSGSMEMLHELGRAGGDLHALTASKFVGRDIRADADYEKDTSKDRKLGKECNNALNYGLGFKKLALRVWFRTGIKISEDEARELHRKYFDGYPEIKDWHKKVEATLFQTQTLRTPFGRTHYFFGNLHDKYSRSKMLRDALSYVPQTTVADALNVGWIRLVEQGRKLGLDIQVLQQCHDSLKLQCPEGQVDPVCCLMKEVYSNVKFPVGSFECNLPIDLSIGDNWGKLVPWEL